jgi:hypothetical protein
LCAVVDSQNFYRQVGRAKDDDIRKVREDEFSRTQLDTDSASSRIITQSQDFSMNAAYCGLRVTWVMLMEVVTDDFKVVSGGLGPSKAHSALKHPFEPRVHLCIVNELAPVGLLDSLTNCSPESVVLVKNPQSCGDDHLAGILTQMRC